MGTSFIAVLCCPREDLYARLWEDDSWIWFATTRREARISILAVPVSSDMVCCERGNFDLQHDDRKHALQRKHESIHLTRDRSSTLRRCLERIRYRSRNTDER